MIPDKYTGPNDDWMEKTRKWLYPKLHPYLKPFGGYGTATVHEEQYIGYTDRHEDAFEKELRVAGFRRNPIAAYKSHPDGRESEGSWVLLAEDSELVEEGMQLHVTLLDRRDGYGREVYAHYEDDWRGSIKDAWNHLRSKNFSADEGVSKAKAALIHSSLQT